MKKIILSLALALSGYCTYAQTNTFPSSGNVGIGTTSPLTGGGNASWLTLNGTSTYSGGNVYSINGTAKGYSYVDNDGLLTQQAVTGQKFVINNTTTAVLINSTGYVGIGTTSTDRLLTVGGQIGITGNSVGLVFKNTNSANKLWDITPSGNDLTIGETGIATPLIIKSGGNVGIGTTSPNATLDVLGGNIAISNNLTVGGADGNGLKLFGNLGNPPYRSVDIVPFVPANAPGVDHVGLKIFTTNGGTTRVNAMTVSDAGNVIIGNTTQTNAAYKLDVYGSARANEIVVNTTGADFVFDKSYSLPKLSDVKKYIEANQHLPEIPSAKEMQTDGMSVGEINTKLLQKVEELTLYLIQQKEENEKLKAKNGTLKENQQKVDQAQEARIAILEKALLKLTENKSKNQP